MESRLAQSTAAMSADDLWRPRVGDLRSHLTCPLCNGYLIDATCVTECLHTFCRSCILHHMKTVVADCPVCHVRLEKNTTDPESDGLRLDRTLQTLVYKMVPSLFATEMARRRCFQSQPHCTDVAPSCSVRAGDDSSHTRYHIYSPEDYLLIKLQLWPSSACGQLPVRYLRCHAHTPVSALYKLLMLKLQLNESPVQLEVLYKNTVVPGSLTLMDIGYMHSTGENETFEIYYRLVHRRKRALSEALRQEEPSAKRLSLDEHEEVEQRQDSTSQLEGSLPVLVKENLPKETITCQRSVQTLILFDADDDEPTSPKVVQDIIDSLEETADEDLPKTTASVLCEVKESFIGSIAETNDPVQGSDAEFETILSTDVSFVTEESAREPNEPALVDAPSQDMVMKPEQENGRSISPDNNFHQTSSFHITSKTDDNGVVEKVTTNSIDEKTDSLAEETEPHRLSEEGKHFPPPTESPTTTVADRVVTSSAAVEGNTLVKTEVEQSDEMMTESKLICNETTMSNPVVSEWHEDDSDSDSDPSALIVDESVSINNSNSSSSTEPISLNTLSDPKETEVSEKRSDLTESQLNNDENVKAKEQVMITDNTISIDGRRSTVVHHNTSEDKEKSDDILVAGSPKPRSENSVFEHKTSKDKDQSDDILVAESPKPRNIICVIEHKTSEDKETSCDCLVAKSPKPRSENCVSDEVPIIKKLNELSDVASDSGFVDDFSKSNDMEMTPSKVDCSVQTSAPHDCKPKGLQQPWDEKNCLKNTDATVINVPSLTRCELKRVGSDSAATCSETRTADVSAVVGKSSTVISNSSQCSKTRVTATNKTHPIVAKNRSLAFGVRNLISDFGNDSVATPFCRAFVQKNDAKFSTKFGNFSRRDDGNSAKIKAAHTNSIHRTSPKSRQLKSVGRPLDLSKRVGNPSTTVSSGISGGKSKCPSKSSTGSFGRGGHSDRISSIVDSLASRQNITLTPLAKSTSSHHQDVTKHPSLHRLSSPPVIPSTLPSTSSAGLSSHMDMTSAYSRLFSSPHLLPTSTHTLPSSSHTLPSSSHTLPSSSHTLPADVVARVEYDLAMRNLLALSHMALSRGQALPSYLPPAGPSSLLFPPHTPSPTHLSSPIPPSHLTPLSHTPNVSLSSESFHPAAVAAQYWLHQKHLHSLLHHPLHYQQQQQQQQQPRHPGSTTHCSATSASNFTLQSSTTAMASLKKSSPLVGCTAPKVRSPPETPSAALRRSEVVGCYKDVAMSASAGAPGLLGRKRFSTVNERGIEK